MSAVESKALATSPPLPVPFTGSILALCTCLVLCRQVLLTPPTQHHSCVWLRCTQWDSGPGSLQGSKSPSVAAQAATTRGQMLSDSVTPATNYGASVLPWLQSHEHGAPAQLPSKVCSSCWCPCPLACSITPVSVTGNS